MNTVTILRTEYKALRQQAEKYKEILGVPKYYFKGPSAKRLDRRVSRTLKEYQKGKYKPVRSLADLI